MLVALATVSVAILSPDWEKVRNQWLINSRIDLMAQYQTLQTRACSHKHHIADMIVTDQFLSQGQGSVYLNSLITLW